MMNVLIMYDSCIAQLHSIVFIIAALLHTQKILAIGNTD